LFPSPEIQPWKGNPWEESTFEGLEENEEWFKKQTTDELDSEVLEKLKEEGLENLESIKYTDSELWEFLTNGNEVENYFKRVGIGLKDTFVGLWDGTKKGTSDAWDYVSSGDMWSHSKLLAGASYRYLKSDAFVDNLKTMVDYHTSGQSWEDLKGGLSSAWDYTSNIGSYLFSKQSVSDLYGYFTSGEFAMDYLEDAEAFATGVDPETQEKISGGARFLAAGSILFKPLKAFKKLDDVGNAAVDTVKKDKGIDKTRPSWRQSEIDVEKDFPEYNAQKSFKEGKEVPYGEKGSSRPDLYQTGHSIEVKNYKITTSSGRSRLVNNVSKQVEKRLSDLPSGTKQSVIIDIRGQNVSDEILDELYEKIMKKNNGKVDIRFKTN
jgi:hypothetical protein